jgi:hypothetical protein
MDALLFGLLSLVWVFGWAVLLVIAWNLKAARRQKRHEMIHDERMAALAKGIPLPELPDYADSRGESPWADAVASLRLNPRWPLGVGAICIMLGTGTSLALRLSGDEYHTQIWSFGLIGIFLGVGLLLHYYLTRPRSS